jgi:chemotaxis protein histidine kinase CheA
VIKSLGRFYRQVQAISGATILGNGTVALILDPERLVHDFVRSELQAAKGHPSGTGSGRASGEVLFNAPQGAGSAGPRASASQ